METIISTPALRSDVKKQMGDILTSISWREIAHKYFGKSSSWLYHKMDGIDGNGGKGGFNQAELSQLKEALNDLSARIATVASSL